MKRLSIMQNHAGRAQRPCRMALLCLFASVILLSTSCSMIDEDLSACEEDYNLNYEVSLQTNLSMELQMVLRERYEIAVANLLEDSLRSIFREFAHDVDLSFYVDNDLRFYDHHIMDADQATYELNLPAENYRHLALANFMEEPSVSVEGTDRDITFQLSQMGKKQVDSHRIGLFTARHDIDIKGNQSQTFDVTFYMVNCASILVIRNDKNVYYDEIWVQSGDFASGFHVNDSVFTHEANPMVNDVHVLNPPAGREVFYAVTFPSCDTAEDAHNFVPDTRADINSDDVQLGDEDEERIWRKYVYVRLHDGSVTRTIINVRKALKAGQAMIIYVDLEGNGSIKAKNPELSTSVTLDWQEGLIIDT